MRNRNTKSNKTAVIAILLIILGLIAYMYNSKIFERKAPVIEVEELIYWNLKQPLQVNVTDDSGIKFARIQLSDGENSITLVNEKYDIKESIKTFELSFPKTGFFSKKNEYFMDFEVSDSSYWNFFSGNSAKKRVKIVVDTKRPNVYVLANSHAITRGGAATVVFRALDDNMKNIYIQTSSGKTFEVAPFHKEGHYIAVIAWPIEEKNFAAYIVADDLAGNVAKERIRYFVTSKSYKVSKMKLTDDFLNDGIVNLFEDLVHEVMADLTPLDKFKYINNEVRDKSTAIVNNATANITYENGFTLKSFKPLKNGAAIASYGDHRIYEYKNSNVGESYHLGIDFASTREADIVLSNRGVVVFAGENGIYGKTVIVDHSLGVYSLYAHCSEIFVSEGDKVIIGDVIAKTGRSGFAFGDHLHFGVIVQGVEVRPAEWMDEKWMKDNVFNIIDTAQKVVQKQ